MGPNDLAGYKARCCLNFFNLSSFFNPFTKGSVKTKAIPGIALMDRGFRGNQSVSFNKAILSMPQTSDGSNIPTYPTQDLLELSAGFGSRGILKDF